MWKIGFFKIPLIFDTSDTSNFCDFTLLSNLVNLCLISKARISDWKNFEIFNFELEKVSKYLTILIFIIKNYSQTYCSKSEIRSSSLSSSVAISYKSFNMYNVNSDVGKVRSEK